MNTSSRSPLVLLLFIYIKTSVLEAQELKVQPEVTGYLGHDVTLPCQIIPGTKEANVTQVQWQLKSPEGEKILIIVSHVEFGVSVQDTLLKERVEVAQKSLIIRKVEMRDAGSYTCSIATFPSGSFERTTNLVVHVLETQEVKVQPEVIGNLGHDVTLPCQLIPETKETVITQVQWELNPPEGEKIIIIAFYVKFGVSVQDTFLKERVEMEEQSLIIRKVEMRDAGSYTCSIATFPRGSFEGTTNLVVQEPFPEQMLTLPRMIAAGVFVLIVVSMFVTTYFIIIRIRREALVKHRVCTDTLQVVQ